jgi:hypothetical protein
MSASSSPAVASTRTSLTRGAPSVNVPVLSKATVVMGAKLFHHDRGLDQDAVAAGIGDRREQRRHGGQHDRARGGDDHEGHRPQQGGLQIGAEARMCSVTRASCSPPIMVPGPVVAFFDSQWNALVD